MSKIRIVIPEVWYNIVTFDIKDDKQLTEKQMRELVESVYDDTHEDEYDDEMKNVVLVDSEFEYSHHVNPITLYNGDTDEVITLCNINSRSEKE